MITDKTAANTFAQLRTGSVLRLRQNFFSSYLVRFLNKLTIFSSSCSLFADQPEIRAERPHVHSGPGHPFQLCCRFMDKNHISRSFWFFVSFRGVLWSFRMCIKVLPCGLTLTSIHVIINWLEQGASKTSGQSVLAAWQSDHWKVASLMIFSYICGSCWS